MAPATRVICFLDSCGEDSVVLKEWFCPVTNRNIRSNPRVALVVEPQDRQQGFQLLGRVEEAVRVAVLDGYAPEAEEEPAPQTERKLVIRIEDVLSFSVGPHADSPPENIEPAT